MLTRLRQWWFVWRHFRVTPWQWEWDRRSVDRIARRLSRKTR